MHSFDFQPVYNKILEAIADVTGTSEVPVTAKVT